jgi:hypothetical protein
MQYQSPFELLGITPEETTAASFSPVMLRKKLLAEFELSGKLTIEVPGGELSKNDVMELTDQLKDTKIFNYHRAIYKDEALREFLLSNHLEGKETFASDPLYTDEEFLGFISPFFVHSYCEFVINCLDNKDYCKRPLHAFPLMVTPGTEYISLEPLRVQIHKIIDDINDFSRRLERTFDEKVSPELSHFFGGHVIHTLKMLPINFFENEIEEYFRAGIVLIDSCIREDRKGYRNIVVVRYVVSNLERMTVPSRFAEGFGRIRNFINRQEEVKQDSGMSAWGGIRLVLFGIILLVNLARLCSSDHSSSQYSPPIYSTDQFRDRSNALLEKFAKDYNFRYLVISLRSPDKAKNDNPPSFSTFQTGDNPYPDLKCISVSPTGRPYKMTFKNQSSFEVVTLVNGRLGSAYIYIAPNDTYEMGSYGDSCTISILAGKKWVANHRLPSITGLSSTGDEVSYSFSGLFKYKAENYQALLAPRKYALASDETAYISITNKANKVMAESNNPSRKVSAKELREN